MTVLPAPVSLPRFEVRLPVPDLGAWREGNAGLAGVVSHAAAAPGPHVVVLAVVHGNEIAGAIALERLLAAGLRPERGRLSLCFANLDAFDRFDPEQPTASRFVDEDFNRIWDPGLLDGTSRSVELIRARELRPLVDSADLLLDLHSMLWPSDPLILTPPTTQSRALGLRVGVPGLVVADSGHADGRRIIDYPRFAEASGAAAILVEAGPHWEEPTVEAVTASIARLLRVAGTVGAHPALPAARPVRPTRLAEVTATVTAETAGFAFVQPWRGGDVLPHRNTLIALDGTAEIRTPYDDCLLVMPSLRASRGHTAVRLARLVEASAFA